MVSSITGKGECITLHRTLACIHAVRIIVQEIVVDFDSIERANLAIKNFRMTEPSR